MIKTTTDGGHCEEHDQCNARTDTGNNNSPPQGAALRTDTWTPPGAVSGGKDTDTPSEGDCMGES